MFKKITIVVMCTLLLHTSYAQADSALKQLQEVPLKYISAVEKKLDTYSKQLTGKTEKTLEKLCRWENNIKEILTKANPAAAQKLFGPGQVTFNSLFQQYKDGKNITEGYKAEYNNYRDQLTTQLKYLEEKKEAISKTVVQNLADGKNKINKLEEQVGNSEALEKFIKERKKLIMEEAVKQLGKNKYLKRINKEAYYYSDALKNYKETFSNAGKLEAAALKLLNKIPAFKKFAAENSTLAAVFKPLGVGPGSAGGSGTIPIVNGIPPRAALQNYLQSNMPSLNNTDAPSLINNKLAQPDMMNKLKELRGEITEMNKAKHDSSRLNDFKPNGQANKSFPARLEYGFDIKFGKSNNFIPASASTGFKIGYKLDDKKTIGIGINYMLGLGRGWNAIKLSHEGIGFRSYLKWALDKNFDLQGSAEWDYNAAFKKLPALKNQQGWEASAFVGLSKKYNLKNRLKGNIQLLFDFLYKNNPVNKSPFIFRTGYDF